MASLSGRTAGTHIHILHVYPGRHDYMAVAPVPGSDRWWDLKILTLAFLSRIFGGGDSRSEAALAIVMMAANYKH
jgi:hypothetical protein